MKKVAIGCLIILGLLVVAVGGGVTWVYFKVSAMTAQVTEYVDEIKTIQSEAPSNPDFQPPQDSLLTDRHVAQLVQVERTILDGMQPVLERHQERVNELKALASEGGDPSQELSQLFDLFDHIDELGELLKSYKQEQVNALNAAGMTLQEYNWARTTAIRSISDIRSQLDLDQYNIKELSEWQDGDVHPENTEKLAEHRELLMETLPWLAFDAVVMSFTQQSQ